MKVTINGVVHNLDTKRALELGVLKSEFKVEFGQIYEFGGNKQHLVVMPMPWGENHTQKCFFTGLNSNIFSSWSNNPLTLEAAASYLQERGYVLVGKIGKLP